MRNLLYGVFFVLVACTGTPQGEPTGPLGPDGNEPSEDWDQNTDPPCHCDVVGVEECCCDTPILIDVAGNGVKLTRWQQGVVFNLVPWYGPSYRAWTEPNTDDAWLFLDSNFDKVVTDGTELFGSMTLQPEPPAGQKKNGFLALAKHDHNGDLLIDKRDAVFVKLRLWQDKNHDGASQVEELHTLSELGVEALSVDYKEISQPDGNGNLFRYSAPVTPSPGATVGMTAWDVTLTSPNKAEREAYGLPDPQTLPDPQRIEDAPAPPTSTEESAPIIEQLRTATCTASQTVQSVTKSGVSAIGKAWWTPVFNCPPYVRGHASLYNMYQGTWRFVDEEIIPAQPPGSTNNTVVIKTCEWTHSTLWYQDYVITLPAGWSPAFKSRSSLTSDPDCSAFRPPAGCN